MNTIGSKNRVEMMNPGVTRVVLFLSDVMSIHLGELKLCSGEVVRVISIFIVVKIKRAGFETQEFSELLSCRSFPHI